MPDGQVLEFTRVTKRFNDVTAVSDFSARVEPGVVTAFLGPNGAGKTTTLRILLGQVRATSGTATIGGTAFPDLRHPLRTIGSVLEETVYRPRRSAARQLTIAAKANGIPLSRVDEVLSLVGLEHESEGRIGSFSLGMRQRLSVAHALLGDPGALVFDEPANGLDPEGIRWMRLLMRRLADEGRTVLVSSHVLSEIEQVADHVLVLSKGHLVLSSDIEKLADPSTGAVVVDADDRAALTAALSAAGLEVEVLRSGLTVRGSDAGTVGAIAASAGIALSTLVQRGPTLEDVFIDLMRGGRFSAGALTSTAPTVAPEALAAPVSAGVGASVAEAGVVSDADADAVSDADADAVSDADADAVADAAEVQADADADAADAAADVEYAAAELGYAADASDANDAEDAADVVSEAADTHVEDGPIEDGVASDPAPASDSAPAPESAQSPSFDEILFGAPAAVSGDEVSADEAPVDEAPVDESAADEASADEAPVDEASSDDASGVEFFAELQDADESSPESDVDAGDAEPASEGDPDDPRSAAVSSMLAAAARAYYEDEPRDYPLGENATAEDGDAEDGDADAAHWSVASTGVIDQVPGAANDSAGAPDSEHDEGDQHEHHEGDQHEHHEGEHHHS
ncbi:ATP-binding cassette domain-containing protein [Microbacterium sp.]|uniref:ATP-binding cassette domain-containing protein n=1 Tax=Microbacterium sp. TaxID=51671 RepID=UPI003567DE0B